MKQIEVIRGPASAVWGANALTGVVNIITKSAREAPGAEVTLGGGVITRNALLNQAVQQHVFGDILKASVVFEIRFKI